MEDVDKTWTKLETQGDCDICGAKDGEWCYVKPGLPLIGSDGKPTGVHGRRLLQALRQEGIDASLMPAR